jgi:hypothetical protein
VRWCLVLARFLRPYEGGEATPTGGRECGRLLFRFTAFAYPIFFLSKYSLKYNNYLCSKSIRRFSKEQANYEIAVGR